jgi:hypothetical protein
VDYQTPAIVFFESYTPSIFVGKMDAQFVISVRYETWRNQVVSAGKQALIRMCAYCFQPFEKKQPTHVVASPHTIKRCIANKWHCA